MQQVNLPVKDFTQWMNEGFEGKWYSEIQYGYQMTKQLLLADGTALSIQAGKSHYCYPREDSINGDYDDYSEFEIGFPSKVIKKLLPYAEDADNPTDTVYGYVPKDLIREIIAECGGVVGFNGENK